MPRRNRNAHALRIDADELAAQADQLTAELAANSAALVIDETQHYYRLGSIPRTGKSNLIRDYLITYITKNPGCQISLTDAKAVTSHGRI